MSDEVVTLGVLTQDQCEHARQWRNQVPEALRTPFGLTEEQQAAFYRDVVCDRRANSRWFSVMLRVDNTEFGLDLGGPSYSCVGMAGLTDIEWENGSAQISLILGPGSYGLGYGRKAVRAILDKAFRDMRLLKVWGECYNCNPAAEFWERMVKDFEGEIQLPEPHCKYIGGVSFSGRRFWWRAWREVPLVDGP